VVHPGPSHSSLLTQLTPHTAHPSHSSPIQKHNNAGKEIIT